MTGEKRLSAIYRSCDTIPFDDNSRIVLISDCHRGDGTWADDFSKNGSIYYAALEHYFRNGYIYIEIGDGDELWEENSIAAIMTAHRDDFRMLNRFYKENRLYMIFGNHDMEKKYCQYKKGGYYRYYDAQSEKCVVFFENIKIHEGLKLKHTGSGNCIFLVHGHQVDFLNSSFWKLARFLVRHMWRPLELFGVNDPTSAARNYSKRDTVENKLIHWTDKEGCMTIAGHTHRPVFPEIGASGYFNDGSCVHPNSITAIEIQKGEISLVKWLVRTKSDGTLFVGSEVIAGPEKLSAFFEAFGSKPVPPPKNGCDTEENGIK
jgi:UDP-2,3-diacylglucosamine pyrophosphatase LpxH